MTYERVWAYLYGGLAVVVLTSLLIGFFHLRSEQVAREAERKLMMLECAAGGGIPVIDAHGGAIRCFENEIHVEGEL